MTSKSSRTMVLSLQGGGALGAYQVGVAEALLEKQIAPVVVSGVSIGAINAAVLCGHRAADPIEGLTALWDDLSRPYRPWAGLPFNELLPVLGNPSMYQPRLDYPFALQWTSFYDTKPLRDTLVRHVDFPRLNPEGGAPRLILTATNVVTGQLDVFDSHTMQIEPEHVVASGSLPPSFPPTTASDEDGRENLYWDAAIFDNTPLEHVVNRLWDSNHSADLFVVVTLFQKAGSVPGNLVEVLARMFEILFSYRLLRDTHMARRTESFVEYGQKVERAMQLLEKHLPSDAVEAREAVAEVRDHEVFSILQNWFSVFGRILEIENSEEEEIEGLFDFSEAAIERRRQAGYRDAMSALQGDRQARA